jgi:hypothetical protein
MANPFSGVSKADVEKYLGYAVELDSFADQLTFVPSTVKTGLNDLAEFLKVAQAVLADG